MLSNVVATTLFENDWLKFFFFIKSFLIFRLILRRCFSAAIPVYRLYHHLQSHGIQSAILLTDVHSFFHQGEVAIGLSVVLQLYPYLTSIIRLPNRRPHSPTVSYYPCSQTQHRVSSEYKVSFFFPLVVIACYFN
jgi:hypothetical protein